MEAKIISGRELSQKIRNELINQVDEFNNNFKVTPSLTVVIVGEDPASQSYVRGKERACEAVGIQSNVIRLEESIAEDELLTLIESLNSDDSVDGILVQLPLPSHLDEQKVIDSISIDKDVDGFHPLNVAALNLGRDCILPCTPAGIMCMLDEAGVEISGKEAVVIGRSNIVGKPIAQLLLSKNATVTICHSRTNDLTEVVKRADIIIAAVGIPKLVTKEMVKEGAVVIDVGVNRVDGKLVGDTDFDNLLDCASVVTPVPGGVGPMTITMLLRNTVELATKKRK